MKKECCLKCFDEGVSQLSYGGCLNSQCPCHAQPKPVSEFPEGKENYCPRCYFDDEKTILRKDCPHNRPTPRQDEPSENLRKKIIEILGRFGLEDSREAFHSFNNLIAAEKKKEREKVIRKVEDFRQEHRRLNVSSDFDIAFDDFLAHLKENKE